MKTRLAATLVALTTVIGGCSKNNEVNVGQEPDPATMCGALRTGELTCAEASLQVCNSLGQGMREVARCPSADLCKASIPASGILEADSSIACIEGCAPGKAYCKDATLVVCKDDGTGPRDEGEVCASAALCSTAAQAGSSQCPSKSCAATDKRCSGGQVEVNAEVCKDDLSGFQITASCADATPQCNPATGSCFDLGIDATEVTREAYQAFLGSSPDPDGQPTGCSGNSSFEPDATCQAGSTVCQGADCGKQPQVCVDWCDAYAYCKSRGKRLCGRIGGGMTPFDGYADAGKSQWMNACSAGGQFPYGPGLSVDSGPQMCSYSGNQLGTSYAVGTRGDCHSPSPGYAAIFDLSGNVAEWEDSCEHPVEDSGATGTDACRTRGGAFDSKLEALACNSVPASALSRLQVAPTVGFRCCQ